MQNSLQMQSVLTVNRFAVLHSSEFTETRGLSKRQMERMYPNDGLRKAFWKSREIEAQAERVV